MTVADLLESLKEFPARDEVYVWNKGRRSPLSGIAWNGEDVDLLDLRAASRKCPVETSGDPSDDDD